LSTAWWLTVLGLCVVGAFLGGYWLRAEQDLARRVTGKTMDFDRPRIGA
jgi:hypothetical protein